MNKRNFSQKQNKIVEKYSFFTHVCKRAQLSQPCQCNLYLIKKKSSFFFWENQLLLRVINDVCTCTSDL